MNSILILIITYILNPILETSAGICAVKSMNHRSLRPTPADFFFYLGIILAVLLVPSEPAIFKWVFGLLLYLVYIFITVEDTALNRFLLFMLTHGSIFLLQCILLGIMYFIFRIEAFNGTGISFLGNFLTFVSAAAFFQLPFAKHLFDYVKQASYLLRILTLNTYLVILFCLAFFKIYPQQIYEILSLVITLLTLLAAINIWILYYDQRTRLQQQEIDSYQKNMPIYDSLIHEIRANQHEYANHLQSLANLSVIYKDYDSLSRALQSYSQEFSNPMVNYPLLQINMPLLAASLYSMASHAQEKGIALQFDIVNAILESHAPEHELTDYITILTQNAIEACKAGETVYALLDSKDGAVRYEIRNPVPTMISPEEIGNFFKRGYSTKQTQADSDAASKQASSDATSKQADDKRGLGLYYLQTNVTKSGGSVGADCVCYEGSCHMIFRLML